MISNRTEVGAEGLAGRSEGVGTTAGDCVGIVSVGFVGLIGGGVAWVSGRGFSSTVFLAAIDGGIGGGISSRDCGTTG